MKRIAEICTLLLIAGSFAGAQTPEDLVVPPAGAGPAPSAYAKTWDLDLRFADLKRIVIRPPHQRLRTEEYWYLLYTVRNPGPDTVQFMPRFELVTSDLKVLDADMGIKSYVFEQIKSVNRATHPHLVHPTKAIGTLRAGDDYARDSVAIWRADQVPGGLCTLYIAGLSGEARLVSNPAYDPAKPETLVLDRYGRRVEAPVNPRHFTIRKTLAIEYLLGGDPQREALAFEPSRQSVRWIMR